MKYLVRTAALSAVIISFAAGAMATVIALTPAGSTTYQPTLVNVPSDLPTATPTHPEPTVTPPTSQAPSPTPSPAYSHRAPTTGGPLPSSSTGEDGGNTGGNPPTALPPINQPRPPRSPRSAERCS